MKMKIVPEYSTDEQNLVGARSIGKTMGFPNHIERARDCYRDMLEVAPNDGCIPKNKLLEFIKVYEEASDSHWEEVYDMNVEEHKLWALEKALKIFGLSVYKEDNIDV